MAITIVSDNVLAASGDYEGHELRMSDNRRSRYSINTKTGSRFDNGWYDWPSMLRRAYLSIVLQPGGRKINAPAHIYYTRNEVWAERLGLPYEEPREDEARRAYRDEFRKDHGQFFWLTGLAFPWSELSDAQVAYIIAKFMALLNQIQVWGGGGNENKNHDLFFAFEPTTAKGRADAMFVLRKGDRNYGRI